MPSPFPGMDPYLEAHSLWPFFHNRFASELSAELNGALPAPYYADVEMREEVGIIEEDGAKTWIVPDVTVVHHPCPPVDTELGGVAVLARPRRELSTSGKGTVHRGKIRHSFVAVRDSSHGHKPVPLDEGTR